MTNFLTITAQAILADAASTGLPYGKLYAGVLVVGFVAAVSLGSIAFYNSKRPVGWEGKERPGFVPKVKSEDSD